MLDLKIAKPCDQTWTAMSGDEQVRHCRKCEHAVYNIAEMTEKEVEELIRRTEGKFCARIYRRSDNRIMTKDCPQRATRVRRIALGATALFAGTLVALWPVMGGATTGAVRARRAVPRTEPVEPEFETGKTKIPESEFTMGAPDVRLGEIAVIPKRDN